MVGQGLAIHHPQTLQGLVLAHTVARYDTAARAAWADRMASVRSGGIDLLRDAFLALKRRAAPGVYGVTWQDEPMRPMP